MPLRRELTTLGPPVMEQSSTLRSTLTLRREHKTTAGRRGWVLRCNATVVPPQVRAIDLGDPPTGEQIIDLDAPPHKVRALLRRECVQH